MRTYISSALSGAFFIGMATAAPAVTAAYNKIYTMGPVLAKRQGHKDGLLCQYADLRQDLLLRQPICPDPVHGRPFGQSHQGTGLLLEEAAWVDQNT